MPYVPSHTIGDRRSRSPLPPHYEAKRTAIRPSVVADEDRHSLLTNDPHRGRSGRFGARGHA